MDEANPRVLEIDVRARFKQADRAASGSLYGLNDATTPLAALLAPLRAKNFTQKAPGGSQRPGGDALVVAPSAAASGGSITIRLADFFPDFPYRWTGLPEWLAIVEQCVHATLNSSATNIYAYEIWNEPNWTWSREAPLFQYVWDETVRLIRGLDRAQRILGPSIERWDAEWMRDFLEKSDAAGTVPDVVSWHILDPESAEDIGSQMREYRAIEASLGLYPRPVSINEYGAIRDVGAPGPLVRYIAALEQSGVDTANLAFWHREGRLGDLVTADGRPTSAWWLYAWYGEMVGEMLRVPVEGGGAPDGFACLQPDNSVIIVVGERTDQVHVTGLCGNVEILWDTITWTGPDGHSDGPVLRFRAVLASVDGVIKIPAPPSLGANGAHRVYLRTSDRQPFGPWGSSHIALPYLTAPGPAQVDLRIDAERPTTVLVDGISQALEPGKSSLTLDLPAAAPTIHIAADASAVITYAEARPWTKRYGPIDAELRFSGLVRTDTRPSAYTTHRFVDDAYISDGAFDSLGSTAAWQIDVPRSGHYVLTVGYANGGEAAKLWIAVDDGVSAHTLPPTQNWAVLGRFDTQIELVTAGSHRIALSVDRGKGRLEYNYIELTWSSTEPPRT